MLYAIHAIKQQISNGEGKRTKGHSGKILANEADNTIAKSYGMISKYTLLSHVHTLIHKAFRNLFILPTQEKIYITYESGFEELLPRGGNCRSQAFLGQGLTKPFI